MALFKFQCKLWIASNLKKQIEERQIKKSSEESPKPTQFAWHEQCGAWDREACYWHKYCFHFGQGDCICRTVILLAKLSRKEHNVPKKRNKSTHILEYDLFNKLLHPPSWNNFLEHDGTLVLLIYLTLKDDFFDIQSWSSWTKKIF